jgi:hypothetical protein
MKLPKSYLTGGIGLAPHSGAGVPWLASLIGATAGLTLAEAKTYPRKDLLDGMAFTIDGAPWVYSASSELDGDDQLVAEFTDLPAAGRLLRGRGPVELALPFTHATADAAVLYTMPAGAYFMPLEFMWSIAADMTGGTASAIGVSSTKTGFTTKGDLLGGATGDVAATLVAGARILGTVGPKWDSDTERRAVWGPSEIFRYDEITSSFTAGSGSVLVVGYLLANAGA